jgi:hypothetical protein
MRASEDTSEQTRTGRRPTPCFNRRRHILQLKNLAGLVEDGDCSMNAGVNPKDGSGNH